MKRLAPMHNLFFVCVVALGPACHEGGHLAEDVATATRQSAVVYGIDNREDWYAHPDASLRALTRDAIVAMMRPEKLDLSDPEAIRIVASSLREHASLCSDQRFIEQPAAADCSGTLIDDDLVLTAAHCLSGPTACEDARFVFNYYYEAPGQLARITRDDVYGCAAVLVSAANGGDAPLDYAIVRLDRPASPRQVPAPVTAISRAVRVGDAVAIVGFAAGTPAKLDSGGRVLDGRAQTLDYFLATTDAFVGNSGSGVFDANRQLVGILVRGNPDYRSSGVCNKVNVLPEDGGSAGGEGITYAVQAVRALCASEHGSARLCSPPGECGDGVCHASESLPDCPADCAPSGEDAGRTEDVGMDVFGGSDAAEDAFEDAGEDAGPARSDLASDDRHCAAVPVGPASPSPAALVAVVTWALVRRRRVAPGGYWG